MSLVLASGSPRRRMLLTTSGIPLAAIQPADLPEIRQPGEAPVAFARRLAEQKAAKISDGVRWVLSADTVVHIDDDIFDKPTDDADAASILRRLSGRWHLVTTAWCLARGEDVRLEHTTTRVRFRALSDAEIACYIATGEGRDKAGAYGVQGIGAVLVQEVSGSYTNVVGLPLAEVLAALSEIGITGVAP